MEMIRLLERIEPSSACRRSFTFWPSVEWMKAALIKHLSQKGEVTPSSFRDLFGTSRKYTIPLLEYFDREGVTVRVGDVRRPKKLAT